MWVDACLVNTKENILLGVEDIDYFKTASYDSGDGDSLEGSYIIMKDGKSHLSKNTVESWLFFLNIDKDSCSSSLRV